MLSSFFINGYFSWFFLSPGFYTAEVFLLLTLFVRNQPKRSRFVLRYLAAATLSLACSLFLYLPGRDISLIVVEYTLKFFFVVFLIFFCFKMPFADLLFISAICFCAQNIADNINNIILYQNYNFSLQVYRFFASAVFLVSYSVVFFIIYKFYKLKAKDEQDVYITLSRSQIIIFVCLTLFFANYLNMFLMQSISTENSIVGKVVMIACDTLIIFSQINALMRDRVTHEIRTINDMWKKDRQAYETSKEKLNALNIQLHDIKHLFKEKGSDEIADFKNIISETLEEYDSFISTGNEALDVVFNENMSKCKQRNIELAVMTNGESISFMNNIDIYTLFGNILSNAIESVSKLEEGKRIISIQLYEKNNKIYIRENNCYQGNINFKDGLPITTKLDQNRHGFGTKSIALLAKKYSGVYSFSVSDEIFTLEIVIPKPKK